MSAATPADVEQRDVRVRVLELVAAGDLAALEALLPDLHPSDVADVLALLQEPERIALMRVLPVELASEALAEMEEDEDRAELLAALAPEQGAAIIRELDDDDAADLIADLDPAGQRRILARLSEEDASGLRELLLFGEETAGRLMTTSLVSVRSDLTAERAIEEVRRQGREVDAFYSVFVVDESGVLQGTVPLDHLILADPSTPLGELVQPADVTVSPDVDQEEVGRLMSRYNLVSMAVVDEGGQLLGRITFDDVIDVIEAEQTEDLLMLAGVSNDEEVRADWRASVRARLPWLSINLITASIAASVVVIFGRTIESLWFLAAIMPIVAGMGGNSGTQSLAVTVRRIALSGGVFERRSDAVAKEALVGLVNGLALGLVAFGVSWIGVFALDGVSPLLPWVVLFALWGNILIAASMGALIPTILHRFGADPAIASSVFLTALTDMCGFLLLLGLATAVLT
jgi:magnesium transporter